MEVTRKAVLIEALGMFEARQRSFSQGLCMVVPEPGYELAWEKEQAKCDVLRKLIYEIESGKPMTEYEQRIRLVPKDESKTTF